MYGAELWEKGMKSYNILKYNTSKCSHNIVGYFGAVRQGEALMKVVLIHLSDIQHHAWALYLTLSLFFNAFWF